MHISRGFSPSVGVNNPTNQMFSQQLRGYSTSAEFTNTTNQTYIQHCGVSPSVGVANHLNDYRSTTTPRVFTLRGQFVSFSTTRGLPNHGATCSYITTELQAYSTGDFGVYNYPGAPGITTMNFENTGELQVLFQDHCSPQGDSPEIFHDDLLPTNPFNPNYVGPPVRLRPQKVSAASAPRPPQSNSEEQNIPRSNPPQSEEHLEQTYSLPGAATQSGGPLRMSRGGVC